VVGELLQVRAADARCVDRDDDAHVVTCCTQSRDEPRERSAHFAPVVENVERQRQPVLGLSHCDAFIAELGKGPPRPRSERLPVELREWLR